MYVDLYGKKNSSSNKSLTWQNAVNDAGQQLNVLYEDVCVYYDKQLKITHTTFNSRKPR